jgi:PAS domain S-box-containing protein
LDYVNGLVLKYFQKSFDEIIGEGWQKGVHPEDIPPVTRAWTRSLQTGEDYHVEFRLKQGSDGEYRRHIARAVAFKDASGKITKWFGANTDIHQFKESEERFRQLAENIDEVFWMTDPTKNSMLYISPGYEKIWGRTVDSLYQNPKQWIDAIVPEDRDRVLDAAMKKQTAGTYDEEYRITRNDGTIRWIHDKAYPIRDEKGNVYRVVGIATDITDQKKTQEKIQENLATIEKLNSFMVGRELKLVELKQEIEELKQKVNTS